LKDEYGLDARLEMLPFKLARWPHDSQGKPLKTPLKGSRSKNYYDINDRSVILLEKEWDLRWIQEDNPEVVFKSTSSD
jgi:peptide chain release factor 3